MANIMEKSCRMKASKANCQEFVNRMPSIASALKKSSQTIAQHCVRSGEVVE